jgi:serine protease Do
VLACCTASPPTKYVPAQRAISRRVAPIFDLLPAPAGGGIAHAAARVADTAAAMMNTIRFPPAQKLLSTLLIGVCAGFLAPALADANPHALAATATPAGLPDFANLVEKTGPTVVNIRTSGKAKAAAPGPSSDDEQMQEFLRRYFGAPDGRRQAPPEEDSIRRGVGSGFIMSADGYVMTNAHVVDGADEVFVKLTDAREFKARLIGADARTDVALLKIDGQRLPAATIGASSTVRVGEWVIAIGSPFDLDNTVTAGIISAKARETGDFLPLIQTDVAVNPGNSGGPLLNMRGEVVGINSQIYSRSGGYMGISFAIPIDEAMRVATQLKTSGHVTRGRLGVYLGDVGKEVAAELGLPTARGGLVGRVEQGGPAERGGLQGGDIILKFNGIEVSTSAHLRRLAAATTPGTSVRLDVWRKGAPKDIVVTVAELKPEAAASAASEATEAAEAASKRLGIVAGDLSDTQRKTLGIGAGIVIREADGAAARAGLRAGDIILTLNNTDGKDTAQFAALLAKADPAKPVLLLARRGETSQFIALRPATK